MSKIITKVVKGNNESEFVLLTINKEKKRFHSLLSGDSAVSLFKLGGEISKKMKEKGFTIVPFEDVFNNMDEFEMYNLNDELVSTGQMDKGEDK